MKNLLPFFLVLLFFTGCEKDTSPYNYSSESTIYSTSKTTQFKELVLIIDPYVMVGNEKQFIVTDTIMNVTIKINNKIWNTCNSFGVDTSIFSKTATGSFYLTGTQTKYSIIAPYSSSNDTLQTAGEYVDLLNNYLVLDPGNYICTVESFEIKKIDGTIEKVKPFIVVPVEIKENAISALVGEFEIQVNNK
ncbi:MAG: hypothetical protein Q8907_16555 [Bacteroidota bacterium]|nr:hypothetical protein [Bacteroidota bacterium]MDP4227339.1 hypothetical protein [Bacteroidota bacterium]MDP4275880.1 hypothetical protein [Bacteroidota bacterium]